MQGLTTSLEFRREALQAGFKATNRTVAYLLAYLLSYLLGGVLLLFSAWPGPLAGLLVLPYVAVCAPFWNVTDAAADTANRGWRRFLLLNFITGFFVTMLMIWWVLVQPS